MSLSDIIQNADQYPFKITQWHNEAIIRSAFDFGYERQDCPPIQTFVKTHNLHDLIKDKNTDIDRFAALTHWVAQRPNTRQNMWSEHYPWTLDQILIHDNGQTAIKGHCMSYAAVLISALTGLGYYARHWAIQGFRFMDHEVVEVWSNELKKWIYLDPSLDQYYTDPQTNEPLSLLEMHRIFVNTFFRDGETLHMPMDQQRERIKKMGGQNAPIRCVDQGYHYGTYTTDYDWGWFHGYLAAGFLRLTMRNNFHSLPAPPFLYFGDGIEDDHGFPHWTDENPPLKTDRIKLFSDREQDFYWTLNQATFKAIRVSDHTLELEFDNSQPFFHHYIVTVNNKPYPITECVYSWNLHPGENTLTVTPQNEWGDCGLSSQLSITL